MSGEQRMASRLNDEGNMRTKIRGGFEIE